MDIYIDPDNGVDTNDGSSHALARKTPPTPASDNNYYFYTGTTYNAKIAVLLNGLDNVTVGAYYMLDGVETTVIPDSIVKPVLENNLLTSTSTGDWVETVDSGVWVASGLTGKNYIAGLGTLGWYIRSNYLGEGPATPGLPAFTDSGYGYGQWDTATSNLYLYSDINPVDKWGTIYYMRDTDNGVRLIGSCTNITVKDIDFKWYGSGVLLNGNAAPLLQENTVIDNNDFNYCFLGVNHNMTLTGTATLDGQISNNKTYDIGGFAALRITGLDSECMAGLKIYNNEMYRTGFAEPVGGIYGKHKGSAAKPVLVYNNHVDTVYQHNSYWKSEWRGYYLESGSANAKVYNNYCKNAQAGLHDNGGTDTVFYGNLVESCEIGLGLSDSNALDNGHVSAYGNTFIDVKTGVNANRAAGATVCTLNVKNNIFISNQEVGSAYCKVDSNLESTAPGLVEDYNIYYNFEKSIVISGVEDPSALGVNDNSSDPLFVDAANGNYELQETSPAVGPAFQWWGSDPRPVSMNGEALPNRKIDIGAYQSTWDPGHPKNL